MLYLFQMNVKLLGIYLTIAIFVIYVEQSSQFESVNDIPYNFPQSLENFNHRLKYTNELKFNQFLNFELLKEINLDTCVNLVNKYKNVNYSIPNIGESCFEKIKSFAESLGKQEDWAFLC